MPRILIGLFTFVVLAALMITGVVYIMAKALSPVMSSTNSTAWKRMIKTLKAHLDKRYANLIPWDKDMLGLLSLNRQEEKKPGWWSTIGSAVYSTIYHEPVLAFARQSSGKHTVTLARTSNHEFIFRKKPKETEIWLNKEPFGLYISGSLISAGREGKLIGKLERPEGEAAYPVLMGDSTAAMLSNPDIVNSPNPRALTLYRDLDAYEENALLALSILNMTGQA